MKKQRLLILISLTLILILSACSGRRVSVSGWAGVTVADGTAYLAYGPQVFAVNASNGSLKWEYPDEPENKVTFYAPPVLSDDGQLILAGYDGVLYSLDPSNKTLNWSYEEAGGRFIASPFVSSEGIFAPSTDNKLYALDLEGNPLWEPFETGEPLWAKPIPGENCECLYIASMDHHVYAVSTADGAEIWKTDDLGGPVVSAPAVDGNMMFVSTFANEVLAINLDNREVIWRFTTEDWAWASPVVHEDQVYASDISGNFYAIDRETGLQNWQIEPGGQIVSPPLVAFDRVYFGTSDGLLIAVKPDGSIDLNIPVEESKLYSRIQAGEEMILVAASEGENLLLGYDPSGVRKWSFSLPED